MRALIVSLLLLSGCSNQQYIERTDHNFAIIKQVMTNLDKRVTTLEDASKTKLPVAK